MNASCRDAALAGAAAMMPAAAATVAMQAAGQIRR